MASYVATGKIQAGVDGWFMSGFYDVIWVEDSSGRKFTVARSWPSVDEYDQSKNLCWVKVKFGYGPIGWIVDAIKSPVFFGKPVQSNEVPKRIKPSYLVFSCKKY